MGKSGRKQPLDKTENLCYNGGITISEEENSMVFRLVQNVFYSTTFALSAIVPMLIAQVPGCDGSCIYVDEDGKEIPCREEESNDDAMLQEVLPIVTVDLGVIVL
jgi:hypothetical protein